MSSTSTPSSSIMLAASASAAKSSKKVTKKTEEVAVAAPVAAAVAAPVEKAVKAKKAVAPVAAAAVAATTATAVAPVTAAATTVAATGAAATVVEEVRLETEVKNVTTRLLALREALSELVTESKRLEKKAARVQKLADKRRRRKTVVEGEEGKPARISIFQIPTNISPALCAFMGRAAGSQESRSNVTKFITTYVKDNNLKNKHDINPDSKLRSLLNVKESDKLTYFNLQKFLNVHYIKAAPAATATA
jgi:chromatin remodeling complex protein RSC6